MARGYVNYKPIQLETNDAGLRDVERKQRMVGLDFYRYQSEKEVGGFDVGYDFSITAVKPLDSTDYVRIHLSVEDAKALKEYLEYALAMVDFDKRNNQHNNIEYQF